MKILAIETCFGKCSVCLHDGTTFHQKIEETKNTHREALPQMTYEILSSLGINIKEINAIVVNHGPGTFTGIRIGIAFAQGLAIPFKIPIYGVSTMEALVTQEIQNITGIAVKAIGDFCYYQQFLSNGQHADKPTYITIASIPQTPLLTAINITNIISTITLNNTPNAKDLIKRFLFIRPSIYNKPLYLRETGIQIPDWRKIIK